MGYCICFKPASGCLHHSKHVTLTIARSRQGDIINLSRLLIFILLPSPFASERFHPLGLFNCGACVMCMCHSHVQSSINQYPQILFPRAACQPLCPKPVVSHGIVVIKVQDLALGPIETHTINLGPSIQSIHHPL